MSKTKTPYVSYNFTELSILDNEASFREAFMYRLLKKKANFKTGVVQGFNGHKISYQELAMAMCRPKSQGQSEDSITRQQARDIIQGLADIGLVTDISTANKELTLTLPHSPMQYEQEVQTTNSTKSTAKIATSTQKSKHGRAEKQVDFHSGFSDIDDEPSVLGSKINIINTSLLLNRKG